MGVSAQGAVGFSGSLAVKPLRRYEQAARRWRLRNSLRWSYIWGWLTNRLAIEFSRLTGIVTFTSELALVHIRVWDDYQQEAAHLIRFIKNCQQHGVDLERAEYVHAVQRLAYIHEHYSTRIDHGVVSRRVVTDAGVTFMRDDFNNNAQDITNFNFHGAGSVSTAEAVGDTALGTEFTTQLNPDSTRATGTRSTPASNQFRSVGTLTFDAAVTAREHGILSQSGTGGGTLWDRSVYADVGVASGDSIQFTYTLSINSGG